jgi:TatD DNase family protein
VIDTHCHLTFPDFNARVPEVLARAASAGVTGCITISTTTVDCLEALRIAKSQERVWSTAGVHPLYSDKGPHQWASLATCIADERCVAWGELGLDNHYDRPPRDVQHAVLAEQLAFIRSVDARSPRRKPIVLHCREAFADLIPILKREGFEGSRFVFHCFTGGPADMLALLDFGAMVSFTGVLTYRNAAEVQEAAHLAPPDRVMIETDAPFLSPEPVRSVRPCEPAFAAHTLAKLAAIRGEPVEKMRERVVENTARFFGVR